MEYDREQFTEYSITIAVRVTSERGRERREREREGEREGREGERESETERQTERQTHRQTERKRDKEREREAGREGERERRESERRKKKRRCIDLHPPQAYNVNPSPEGLAQLMLDLDKNDTALITFTITDINDNAPLFTMVPNNTCIYENTPAGTVVGTSI